MSGQGFLDNSQGLLPDAPLMAGDVCWLVVKVADPGNEYTFAAAHPAGHPDKVFHIRAEDLRRLSHSRERG